MLLFRAAATEKGDHHENVRGEKTDPALDVARRSLEEECKPGAGGERLTGNHD
jgi:hypothetical protein